MKKSELKEIIREMVMESNMDEGKVEDLMSGYLSSGGKEIRKIRANKYDGGYDNSWGKMEFDLLKNLKRFEVSSKVYGVSAADREVGKSRYEITKIYKDGGKKWVITYKVEQGGR